MAEKILNQSQAEAVYSAMCHLNNVGGKLSARMENIRVEEVFGGEIQVWIVGSDRMERHYSQSDFATAYGLQQG